MSASDFSQTTLVAGAAPVVILEREFAGRFLSIDIQVAVAALTGLELWGRFTRSGNFQPIATSAADFSNLNGIAFCVVSAGTAPGAADPTVTPAGSQASIGVRGDFISALQLRAKSGGAAVVNVATGEKQ